MTSTYSLLSSLAIAERSESEVSAAIMEAGRKLGNELKERQQEVVASLCEGGMFSFCYPLKWEEPLLFGASLDF